MQFLLLIILASGILFPILGFYFISKKVKDYLKRSQSFKKSVVHWTFSLFSISTGIPIFTLALILMNIWYRQTYYYKELAADEFQGIGIIYELILRYQLFPSLILFLGLWTIGVFGLYQEWKRIRTTDLSQEDQFTASYLLRIFTSLGVVMVVLIGGYQAYGFINFYRSKIVLRESSSQIPGWVVYKNIDFGFSMSIPNEYANLIVRQPRSIGDASAPKLWLESIIMERGSGYPFFHISIYDNDPFSFYMTYPSELYQYSTLNDEWWLVESVGERNKYQPESITGNGWKAYRFNSESESDADSPAGIYKIVYVIPTKTAKTVVEVELFSDSSVTLTRREVEQLSRKIMSTFALSEATIQNETSNWKTYRSDEHGLELKYPASMTILEGVEYPDGLHDGFRIVDSKMNQMFTTEYYRNLDEISMGAPLPRKNLKDSLKYSYSEVKEVFVDNTNGYKVFFYNSSIPYTEDQIWVEHGGGIYIFSYNSSASHKHELNLDSEMIISSIRWLK